MHRTRLSLTLAVSAVAVLLACTDVSTLPSRLQPGLPDRTVSPLAGSLVINEFMADPSAVTDANGEWFEIHNRGTSAVNIQNFQIASGNDAVHTITASVSVPAGGYVVLGNNASTATNGGVTEAYSYGSGINLANASDWISLRDASGATVDSVNWASTVTPGTAWGVKDPSLSNSTVSTTNWVLQTSMYGAGDKGTPRAQNNGYVPPAAGPVASVVITPSSASVAAGSTVQFSAQGYDANGVPSATTYTWSSGNTAAATVSSTGLATGVAAGTAQIRATAANGVYKEATLTVTSSGGGGSALTVRFLDVGQGDATYISNGTSNVIIDGGPDTVRFGKLLDSLGLNGKTIDLVVLSHEHYDHHSGLMELFKSSRNITVKYFEENQNVYSNAQLQRLRDSINARVARGTLIYRDTDDPCANGSSICTFTLNGGAKIHVLKPNPAGTTPNNRSAAEKIVGPDSASFTMWLAGDAEQEEIGWFLGAAGYATNPGMKVNVMKADHHGSCNGVTNAYVNTLNPSWVLAGVGATNTYGHMHNQAKTLYTAHGKPWYRTDGNGTVVVSTPGTVGGGYTVTIGKGTSSMNGSADATSTQTQCNPIP